MIQSMTGYGKSERRLEQGTLSVEIRALNNRFLDISLRLPEMLETHEDEIKGILRDRLIRGRLQVSVTLSEDTDQLAPLSLNTKLLAHYHRILSEAAAQIGLEETIRLEHLLSFENVLEVESPDWRKAEIERVLRGAVDAAISEVLEMRRKEGKFLGDEVSKHLDEIHSDADEIFRISDEEKTGFYKQFKTKLLDLCEDVDIAEDRLIQEAALYAKKVDLTEEYERICSHIDQFRTFLKSGKPVGKKMNFLIQEMNREVSTIGSKAENAQISHLVVELKNELEKIREQVQNIL